MRHDRRYQAHEMRPRRIRWTTVGELALDTAILFFLIVTLFLFLYAIAP